ncbi:hypothetical protein [Aliarcobacter cryaerophilus]|uniref:hypothetical protein n=1 Tax=Aliarcobacter cryaerophilus TaxID=28198 RepID=UPI0008315A86|nr:hypothetical protein [Aliarcobacter cryaerophilus]
MVPVAGAGISLGTVVLIGGVVVVAGIAYLMYKNSDNIQKNKSNKPIKKLIDDDDKYNGYKDMIETAIYKKDWQTLEDLLDSRVKKYTDLIKMIEEALKNKQ